MRVLIGSLSCKYGVEVVVTVGVIHQTRTHVPCGMFCLYANSIDACSITITDAVQKITQSGIWWLLELFFCMLLLEIPISSLTCHLTSGNGPVWNA